MHTSVKCSKTFVLFQLFHFCASKKAKKLKSLWGTILLVEPQAEKAEKS
jgi:hypothetical protein